MENKPISFRFFKTTKPRGQVLFAIEKLPVTRKHPRLLRPKVNLRRLRILAPQANFPSRFLRRLFENQKVKTAVGTSLALLAMLSGLIRSTSTLAAVTLIPSVNPELVVSEPKIDLTTKESVVMPIPEYRVTQGFSFFHPAIDLAIDVGTAVHPIMDGVVIESGWSWIGYGNTIVIDHQNGYSSRYAHLSKIFVTHGERVTTDSILGLSGSTGHSSGPHLHLEIADHGIRINPRSLLE